MDPNAYTISRISEMLSSDDESDRLEALAVAAFKDDKDGAVDQKCRMLLYDPSASIQTCAAMAVATRGLLDCVDLLADRIDSSDWTEKTVYADGVLTLLTNSSDDYAYFCARHGREWTSLLACVALIRRGRQSKWIRRRYDALRSSAAVAVAMHVPSPELDEVWERIVHI